MSKEKTKGSLSDGLWRQNVVLVSGLLIGPVAAGATNFENAVAIALVFTPLTLLTVLACRLIPRKIVYTVRVILYALVAALFYIPTIIMAEHLVGSAVVTSVGIYLPILMVNPVILTKSETRFYLMPLKDMLPELLGYVLGFGIVCITTGLIRDIAVNGRIGWFRLDTDFSIPAMETTFGGFIMLGIAAAVVRQIMNRKKET
ncbi:MAG: NADH:ubiquinone oxidoreductase subunit RnfE [Oscillospiraceae bacterium]|nr:NADH:ubiquinone oxidoreductase subunit RnfE [Oscillospiraceae bacterium]